MKTVISVRTDKKTKDAAQAVADNIGIPLGTLINAYLRDLAITGRVEFTASEPMTPFLERKLARINTDIKSGRNLSPVFDNVDEAIAYLRDK